MKKRVDRLEVERRHCRNRACDDHDRGRWHELPNFRPSPSANTNVAKIAAIPHSPAYTAETIATRSHSAVPRYGSDSRVPHREVAGQHHRRRKQKRPRSENPCARSWPRNKNATINVTSVPAADATKTIGLKPALSREIGLSTARPAASFADTEPPPANIPRARES